MDTLNKQFYKLNKNSEDIIYPFATEMITYRKQTDETGNLQIIEIRQIDGKKGKVCRIVPAYEMTIAEFDEWKKKLTDEAHEYFNKDSRETRYDVGIETLLDSELVSSESIEEEYIRLEGERIGQYRDLLGLQIFDTLTDMQKKCYFMNKAEGKSTYEIGKALGITNVGAYKHIKAAEKVINKKLKKRTH